MNTTQPGDPFQLRGYGGETVDGHISHQYSLSDVNSTYGSRIHSHGPNGSAHVHEVLQPSPSVTPSPGGTLGRGKQQLNPQMLRDGLGPESQHLEYGRSPNRYASNYEQIGVEPMYRTHSPVSEAGSRRYDYRGAQGYVDYDAYPPGSRSDYVYQPGLGPGAYGVYGESRGYPMEMAGAYGSVDPKDYMLQGLPYPPSGYSELDNGIMPSGRDSTLGGAKPQERFLNESHMYNESIHPGSQYRSPSVLNGMRDYEDQSGVYLPDGAPDDRVHRGLSEQMSNLSFNQAPQDQNGVRWRNPDLPEVIAFLSNPDKDVRANAAAYLQHLSYNSDNIKQKTRLLGGLPPLVALLDDDAVDVYRNACGALRNLSYGRQNDENKRSIHRAGGVTALVRLLRRSKAEEVHELTTSVLWNLSSCEELKRPIIDESLTTIIAMVLIPHSGYDKNSPVTPHWSTVLRNTTGILRNVSSAGEYARKILREANGLVEALLYLVRVSVQVNDIENKSVENTVCVLRNLSYRCQEVEDPNYDKHPLPTQSRATAQPSNENFGCFGATKKKKDSVTSPGSTATGMTSVEGSRDKMAGGGLERSEPPKGMELLWQPDVVQPYLALLSNCSNPETLEAAAGALQNLAACYWQPAIELRAAVRKEKGLPVLVELLRMEVDRVVCAVATALRNLALDQRNKELIGKYAMRDLVQKLPTGNAAQDQATSDDTISAVLATLNEVIKKNAEFSRSLLEAEGVPRLINLARPRQGLNRSPRVAKFASQVLVAMWSHQELRDVYKKNGFKESDFVARGSTVPSSPPPTGVNSSTLNRPMASQGGTRYEDKTLSLQRGNQRNSEGQYRDTVPMADMQYGEGGGHAPPVGGVRILPPGMNAGEPVYAQVNREKKRSRHFDANLSHEESNGPHHWSNYEDAGRMDQSGRVLQEGQPGGDSWV